MPPSTIATRVPAPRALLARARPNVGALHAHWWPILQAALTAGAAWYLASLVLGPNPFYAPVAVISGMALWHGDRGVRVVRIVAGTGGGVALANVLRFIPGETWIAVGAAAGAAFLVGVLIYEEGYFLTSMAFAGIFQLASGTRGGVDVSLFLESLVGGATALLVTQVLLPTDPRSQVDVSARALAGHLCAALRETAGALRAGARTDGGDGPLSHARRAVDRAHGLELGLVEARRIARLAPRRRPERATVRRYAERAEHLHQVCDEVTALVHASQTVIAHGRRSSPVLAGALEELAEALEALPNALRHGEWLPVQVHAHAAARATADSDERLGGLTDRTAVGLVRETVTALLMVSGENPRDAARGAVLAGIAPPPSSAGRGERPIGG